MKISIVMATYNGETYIEEQLDSIFHQSCPPHEVIICDDCSTDRTVDKIQRYMKKYSQIQLHVNEKNLGFGNNFKKAMDLASGDYIFFSDQDDIWDDNKISIMLKEMEKKKDCLLLCSDYEPFCNGEWTRKPKKRILKRMPDNGSIEKVALVQKNIYLGALGCCMCLKKEFREKIQQYWFDGWAHDDRCWKLAVCMNGCYLLHRNLVKHRIHENNAATYGVYHTPEKRLKLLTGERDAWQQTELCAKDFPVSNRVIRDICGGIRTLDLRIELINSRKYINSLRLLGKLKYYQTLRSYVVELLIALRQPAS